MYLATVFPNLRGAPPLGGGKCVHVAEEAQAAVKKQNLYLINYFYFKTKNEKLPVVGYLSITDKDYDISWLLNITLKKIDFKS